MPAIDSRQPRWCSWCGERRGVRQTEYMVREYDAERVTYILRTVGPDAEFHWICDECERDREGVYFQPEDSHGVGHQY